MRKLRRGCPVRCIKHVCHVLDSFGMSYFTAHGQSQRTTCGVVWSVVNTGVRVNQVKPSNCFRRLEKLALPPIFGTRLPSLMTWNLRSYRTTVLTVQECDIFLHFRGVKTYWPLLHIFRGTSRRTARRLYAADQSHQCCLSASRRHLEKKRFHSLTRTTVIMMQTMSYDHWRIVLCDWWRPVTWCAAELNVLVVPCDTLMSTGWHSVVHGLGWPAGWVGLGWVGSGMGRKFVFSGLGWVMGLKWEMCEKYMSCIYRYVTLCWVAYPLGNSFCENL